MLATRTFLFADLRDYTLFVERHGDAAAAQLIADYRRIVRAELARHEGGEVKTEGDSFYVVFSTTAAAVSCAAGILREADRYSADHPDRPLRIGIGIHAGEPVPHEGQFVGSSVIVAARLAQTARAGELLITEVVRALLPRSGTLPTTERTGLALKGLESPPRVFAVDWKAARAKEPATVTAVPDVAIAAGEPASQQVLCPVVVGREREVEQLEDLILETIAGRGRTVLLSGDAGLGKSALVRRFVERARTHGVRVLLGECTEIEARRPFGPFIDAFIAGDTPLPSQLEQAGPGAMATVEVERYRVHSAFADRISEAAQDRPVAIVIEDVHWADSATNELVPYLARKLRDQRVLMLLTYRSDELHRLHPLNHVLAELARGRLADEIKLKRLDREEVGEVIRRALALSRTPTAEFRQALYDRTEGNPFFIEEILRALVEKGELAYREGSWHRTKAVAELAIPTSVSDAVQQRLSGLEPKARKAIQVAAVIGQRFDFELLQAVSGFDEAVLLEAIRSAVEAQLVREEIDASGTETYAFRHALSREAVLAELLQRERRLLHRSVGETIERLVGERPEERAEQLAYHFDEARDTTRAYRYHQLAADRSLRMSAPQAAIQHLERAIELAPDDDSALVPLSLRLSDVAMNVADTSRALRAAEQARSIAEANGDALAAGEAIRRIAQCRWYMGETKRAAEIAREGVASLEPLGPSAALAACLSEVSRLAMIDSRTAEAIEFGERALAMAREVGAREVEIHALNTLGTTIGHDSSRSAEALGLLQQSFDLAEAWGYPDASQRALNNMGSSLSRGGAPFGEILAVHDRSVIHARKHGLRSDALMGREVLYATLTGEWDTALAVAEEGLNDGIWSAGREIWAAMIRVARTGPEDIHFEAADAAAKRLLAAGDRQWVAAATTAAGPFFIAERFAEAMARCEPALRLIGVDDDDGPQIVFASTAALRSAELLGDEAAIARWSEVMSGPLTGHRGRDAIRLYAAGSAARRSGDLPEAARLLAASDATMADQPPFVPSTIRGQALAEIQVLIAPDEARTSYAKLAVYWRKGKATWYLGRLEAWAGKLGIAVPA